MSNIEYYVIVNKNDITKEMLEESNQPYYENLRWSLDGTKAIITYSIQYPNTAKGYKKYTADEMRSFLAGNIDWGV